MIKPLTDEERFCDAYHLLDNPLHWTKYFLARNVIGIPCDPLHKTAVCFSADGAMRKSLFGRGGTERSEFNKFCVENYGASILEINDSQGYEFVRRAMEKFAEHKGWAL